LQLSDKKQLAMGGAVNLSEIMRVIRRRWYVVLPTVIVAAALTAVAAVLVPVKYQSQSSIALLNTPLPTEKSQASGNPFLSFDTSLTATADFLSRSLASDESVKDLKALGVTEDYTAKLADNAMGPFIALTVIGPDKSHVMVSAEKLTVYAERKLQQIQKESGAPANNLIHSARIIPPQQPQSQTKTKVEAVAGAAAGGLTLAFLVTFLTDSLARSRQRKRTSTKTEAPPETSAELTAEIRLPALMALDRHIPAEHTRIPSERPVALDRSGRRSAPPQQPTQSDRPGAAAVYRSRTAPVQRQETDPFVGG
jgi:capsular polysaccharide biosynthesis protein